jgi:hypothetical protein
MLVDRHGVGFAALIPAGMAVIVSGITVLGSGVAWHANGQPLIVAAVIASR